MALMLHALAAAASPPSRPNVLIFLIDDMGYSDLAGFGSPNVSTPHIDGDRAEEDDEAVDQGGVQGGAKKVCTCERA